MFQSLRQKAWVVFPATVLSLLLAGCDQSDPDVVAAPPTPPVVYTATLSGAQENPPVLTAASGTATFQLDTRSGVLTGTVVTANMTGTVAHLHIAPVGVNGGVSIPLNETVTGSGSWTVPAATVLTIEQRLALASGNMYANIHSTAYPGGLIRGQIGVDVRAATLTGTQENPPVATAARGSGIISVDPNTRALIARVTTTGMAGTAAHIHSAALGVNGGVIVPLTETAPGSGVWTSAATAAFDAAQYAAFLAGNLYFNVHSTANPGGEIRGQIGLNVIDVVMSGTQEVPANTTTATGSARLLLNPQTLSLTGTITTAGMTGTAAHIHTGVFGANGGVTFPFTATTPGGNIWTMAATTLTTAQLQSFLAGDMYTNAHSAAFPGGEVRGQIGEVLRTATLSGTQEVPPNTTTATGRGVGRFDPVTLAASFVVTSTVVSPTAAHIHTGAIGANGGVTVGFTQTTPGTWTSAATASLTAAQGAAFAAGGMYYNVHSAAFPGGEVRGQATGRE